MSTTLIRPVASVLIDTDEYGITEGSVKLDAGAVPYARASVTLPLLDDATLDYLDPRDGDIRCPITGGDLSGAERVFNLGLRSRTVDHQAKTVRMDLASDEALLQDYSVLDTDKGARAYQSSLRAVVNYVLGKIGAALEPGSDDANVTAYFPITNLHPNPRPFNAAGYGAGSGATGVTKVTGGSSGDAIRWTSSGTLSNLIVAGSLTAFRVTPGRWYTFVIEHASEYAGRGSNVALQWRNNGGASTMDTVFGTGGTTSAPYAYTRRTVTAQAPAGSEFVYPLLVTSGNSVASFHFARFAMVYEGDEVVPYFDGSTTDTADYIYAWSDPLASDASSSTRTPVNERLPAVFTWQPGVSAWDFLLTLTAVENLILWCDENRDWFLATPENRTISGVVSISSFNVRSGTDELSRDNAEAFSTGIALRYTWTDDDGIQRTAVDTAGTPEKVYSLTFSDTPFPGPGVAAAMLARRQGTGRVQDVDAITVWTATPGMTASVALPGAPDTIGRVASVDFDLGIGFMRVGTSGLVDIIPGSIAALSGTIASLPGTIAGL